jgi:two-component system phosphate regulon sensor histidine kinase PhoR
MAHNWKARAALGGAVGIGGALLAVWAGGAIAVPLALLAGAGAVAILRWPDDPPTPPPLVLPKPKTPDLDLAELMEAVDEPLIVVRERRVAAANAAARALLGDHIVGVDVRLALRHPAATEQLIGSEGEEGASRTELVGLGEDPDRPWTMIVSPLSAGGRLVRLADLGQARAAERMRIDFVANASHELRTPLATLLGFLETLEDEEVAADPVTRARFLGIMADEAKRMRSLVDDLLSLSRIEGDRFAPPSGPVDLVKLANEVKAGLAQPAAAQGSAIEIENEAAAPFVVGDPGQLAQMLANLVANALKYGRPGTPVHIRLEDADPGTIRIRVIDEGEGIAPEHLPRLTERFYRVDAGRSRAAGGTGLGLAIVKHIVLRHRGRLEIRSTPGKGTSVRVDLPRAAV